MVVRQFDSETQAMQHLTSLARLRGTIAARAILGFAALGELAVRVFLPPHPPTPENPSHKTRTAEPLYPQQQGAWRLVAKGLPLALHKASHVTSFSLSHLDQERTFP